jgi:hypothetical protein
LNSQALIRVIALKAWGKMGFVNGYGKGIIGDKTSMQGEGMKKMYFNIKNWEN